MSSAKKAKASTEREARIWDWFAEGYSKQPIADQEAYQKKLQVTQSYLKPTDSVVEFGCGTGGTSILHSPFVQKILSTDISGKMIDIAKQRGADAGVDNVEFRQTSVQELDLPPNSQDVVLGLSILHLLPQREEAMRKVHSWLKPGGLFVTSTICAGDMGASARFVFRTILPIGKFFGFLPTVNSFTKAELKESFEKTGFDVEYEWKPDKQDAAVFIIGKKRAE